MVYGLTAKEIGLIEKVFQEFPEVENVFIYGSHPKGNFKKTSDIDFGVEFADAGGNQILRLRSALNDLPIIYEIDALDEREIAGKDFKNEYQNSKKLFYRKLK